VQTSSIAIMSTGMVLLIVMRQIDLSIGSMLSLVASRGVLQVFELGRSSASATRPSGSLAFIFMLASAPASGASTAG
jgi:D-xylose transport system permease protein